MCEVRESDFWIGERIGLGQSIIRGKGYCLSVKIWLNGANLGERQSQDLEDTAEEMES